jgi:hypothetical protein
MVLATITAGADTCRPGQDTAKQIQSIEADLRRKGLQLETKFLCLIIPMAFTQVQREQWKAWRASPGYAKGTHVILEAKDVETFSAILKAVASLSAPNADERVRACDTLIDYSRIQEDVEGTKRMEKYRDMLSP